MTYPGSATVRSEWNHCWSDSTEALYWIIGQGEYRQFVLNRVRKIQDHSNIQWHYAPTEENPAGIGSRGGSTVNNELSTNGTDWLSGCPSSERETGPLKTTEIRDQYLWWTKRVQQGATINGEIEKSKVKLNLQLNDDGALECRGRIKGDYPIFLPQNHLFTRKLVEQVHLTTLHGGVGTNMAKIRDHYWIPKLRQLVKRVRSDCWDCKRFRVQSYENPPPGNLPTTRTQGTTPLQSLERFIARRGRPRRIYSDNGATSKAAEKWLKRVQPDEQCNSFLTDRTIEWKFNLSRGPWWGGQFERLIGLFKRAFHKSTGNGILSFKELEDVVLDVEVALNDRPLSYLEDDIELPVLTPATMLNVNPSRLPELKPRHLDEKDLRRRAKFLKGCKRAVWKRWSREYIRSLRERHANAGGKQASCPRRGSAVIIADESKNRNTWKLGIVSDLIKGKDSVVRGAKVRTANGVLERAIQQLYPLELSLEEKNWEPKSFRSLLHSSAKKRLSRSSGFTYATANPNGQRR